MRFALVSSLALAVSVVACGGTDICDRAQTIAASSSTKLKDCSTTTTTTTVTAAQVTSCKNAESKCTDADKKLVNAYLDCQDKIAAPACTQGGDNTAALTTYGTASTACISSSGIAALSTDCQTALAAESSTSR